MRAPILWLLLAGCLHIFRTLWQHRLNEIPRRALLWCIASYIYVLGIYVFAALFWVIGNATSVSPR